MNVFRWTNKQFIAFCNGWHRGDQDAARRDIKQRGYTLIVYKVSKA